MSEAVEVKFGAKLHVGNFSKTDKEKYRKGLLDLYRSWLTTNRGAEHMNGCAARVASRTALYQSDYYYYF